MIPEVDVPGHAHAAVVAMKQRYINTGSDKYEIEKNLPMQSLQIRKLRKLLIL